MRQIIVCSEYPPAPTGVGGIGTYVLHISKLLAESGDTVHVITKLWKGATKKVEKQCQGRLIIHRVPLGDWPTFLLRNPIPASRAMQVEGLFQSDLPAQCFAWQASLLVEDLVAQEGIELIEAQDYDAPLYYFQLRRALGIGKKSSAPCFIHLHSPTEFIARHNDWSLSAPAVLTANRLEAYSIGAADALLCPSRYLARQAEAHYGLAPDSIHVIPLPVGDTPFIERDNQTWEEGSVCYVGRLERRKGVIEWIDAAVAVAREHPTISFEFVGTNHLGTEKLSGEDFVQRRIPADLKMRFLFRGHQPRSALPQLLARARIAVVPSRWENFPNTCVEAMSSGLPVIASPEGGMAEMIEDGRNGWLSVDASTEGLAEALRRAIETPASRIAAMGQQATSDIRLLCDNQKTLERHLDFRRQLVTRGAERSFRLPANLPWAKTSLSDTPERPSPKDTEIQGIAVVITCFNAGVSLRRCLRGLEQQTRKPESVVVVDAGSTEEQTQKMVNQAQWEGWQVVRQETWDPVVAKHAGIQAILDSGSIPLAIAFLDAEDHLRPNFVAVCEDIFLQNPAVGIVSCWVSHAGSHDGTWIRPCPSFPYQWLGNDAVTFSAVRTEAITQAGSFRPLMSQGYENWDLFNAVMAAGWIAVTVPDILGIRHSSTDALRQTGSIRSEAWMHREILSRFPSLVSQDALDIVLLSQSGGAQTLSEQRRPAGRQQDIPKVTRRRRRGKARRVLRKLKNMLIRITPEWMYKLLGRYFRDLQAYRSQRKQSI